MSLKSAVILTSLLTVPALIAAKAFSSEKIIINLTLAAIVENHADISASPSGQMFYRGLELGLEQLNKDLKSKNISLSWTKQSLSQDPKSLIALAHSLQANKKHILIGPIFSSESLLTAEALNKLPNPPLMISPAATANSISKYNHFLLATALPNKKQGERLAKLVKKSSKRIAVIAAADCIYCQDLKKSFLQSLPETISVKNFSVLSEDISFKNLEAALAGKTWDLVLLPNYELLNARLMKVFAEKNIQVHKFIGGDGWGWVSPAFYDIVGQTIFPWETLSHWGTQFKKSSFPQAYSFQKLYKKKYRENPSEIAALAYNASLALKEILHNQELLGSGDLRKKLKTLARKNFSFSGVLGSVSMEEGQVNTAPMIINHYKFNKKNKIYEIKESL